MAVRTKLVDALAGHFLEDALTSREQRNQDAAAVIAAAGAANVSVHLQAVDELHGAVVLQCQAVGKLANGRFFALAKAPDHQQEQVLLGLEAGGARYQISFAQEMADAVAEFREGPVFFAGDVGRHPVSISCCDTLANSLCAAFQVIIRGICCRPTWCQAMNRPRGLRSFSLCAVALAAVAIAFAAAQIKNERIPVFSAKVVKAYPHDPKAFTQGLEFYDGHLFESTGRTGESSLREDRLETGEVLRRVSLPADVFGEGLTIFHGKIYQLTWLSKIGYVYDVKSLRKIGKFHYESEGWGLTHDDASLILSDGTNKLQFIDPVSFAVTKTLEVYAGNEAVVNLNELELIKGEIFANIWHAPRIARIDPRTGQVRAWIDLSWLVAREQRDAEDVLNGIAYDAKRGKLLVTGKRWSKIIEIEVENVSREP
jgi:glutamine cyclotransferase